MSLTNRKNKWIMERRKKLIKEFGGECEECPSTETLEFAHKEPTELSGWGRGRENRVYDVIKNPTKYRLLCKDCHKEYDQKMEEDI